MANKGHGGVIYLRYLLKSGEYDSSLLGFKAKVGKLGVTPRYEMNGLLALSRFIIAVLEGLYEKPLRITIARDSICTILSVETD